MTWYLNVSSGGGGSKPSQPSRPSQPSGKSNTRTIVAGAAIIATLAAIGYAVSRRR